MKRFPSRHHCALGALAAALAFTPTAAFAQDVGEPDADLVEGADVEDQNVIIVTAQGRSQVLADVPVAVSAVSGETLQNSGASDIRELNQVAPSLLVSSTGNEANGSARIRGIGTVGDNPGLESSVAVFVDGVYRSRSGSALSELGLSTGSKSFAVPRYSGRAELAGRPDQYLHRTARVRFQRIRGLHLWQL